MTTEKTHALRPQYLQKSFQKFAVTKKGEFHRFANQEKYISFLDDSNTKGLLLYDNPALVLAEQIALGKNYLLRLEHWMQEADEHLRMIRAHRGSLLIMERVPEPAQNMLAMVKAAYSDVASPLDISAPSTQASPIMMAIACLSIRENENALRYLSELHASSPTPPEQRLVITADAMEIMSSFDSIARDQESLTALREEVNILQVQAKENEAIREHLLGQVTDLQLGFEIAETQKRKAKQQHAQKVKAEQKLSEEVGVLKSQLDLLYNSTSWKISAPVRILKSLFKR